MQKNQIFLIALVLIFIFLLIYTPHFTYPFPLHIDEWHHITESTRLDNREYSIKVIGFEQGFGFEIGFHFFLLLLSKIFNLILVYKFLPAIFACISALVLFFVVYKKTDNFLIALFSMIFFASIRSNVNILGLLFFNPLTFSIPFIFLYIYYFTEGIEKQNKKFITISFAIMFLLLLIHPISVSFAIPFLLIYSLIHLKYIKKEYKLFSIFSIIPIIGIFFYWFMRRIPLSDLMRNLINELQFKYGWGVFEIQHSFLSIYSLTGFFLIFLWLLFSNKSRSRRYLIYILWPLTLLISIFIFKFTGISYLAPYQRNFYYFALSLPILSASGLYFFIQVIKTKINKIKIDDKIKRNLRIVIPIIVCILVFYFTFRTYFDVPEEVTLYNLIDNDDYNALLFLSNLPRSTVMAAHGISTTLYPIAQQRPVATKYFYRRENKKDVKTFFDSNCEIKKDILKKYKVSYVLSKSKINCGWDLIYDEGDYIYKVIK